LAFRLQTFPSPACRRAAHVCINNDEPFCSACAPRTGGDVAAVCGFKVETRTPALFSVTGACQARFRPRHHHHYRPTPPLPHSYHVTDIPHIPSYVAFELWIPGSRGGMQWFAICPPPNTTKACLICWRYIVPHIGTCILSCRLVSHAVVPLSV